MYSQLTPYDDPPIKEFKLLTYNIFIRPPPIKSNKGDFKDGRLQQFQQHYANKFDVIVLQELFGALSGRKQNFFSHCKPLGLNHQLSIENKPPSKYLIDGGVSMVSRFKFRAHDQIIFKEACVADALAAKGVLYGKIELNQNGNEYIHIFGTHLQAPGGVEQSKPIRASQIIEALTFIREKTKNDKRPIIFCGDFNIAGGSDLYREFVACVEQKFKFTCRDILYETAGYHPITHGEMENGKSVDQVLNGSSHCQRRLDYIFVLEEDDREKLEWKDVKVEKFKAPDPSKFPFLSDHYGISAVVSITSN